jgi:hypothetical protein
VAVQPAYFMTTRDTVHYRFILSAQHCDWPVVITQQPGDTLEGEPDCYDGYHDTFNPGCDGNPGTFRNIACGDTILGTAGVFHTSSYVTRDIDWYQFNVPTHSIISMTVVSEFEPYIIISNYCPGCEGGLAESSGLAGDTVRASTMCVDPGPMMVCVFPNDWSSLPCGTPYRMWITCEPCAPCETVNRPGDLVENEPPCSTWVNSRDHFNGGCNSDPPVFGPELHCGQAIWGRTGTYWGNEGPQRDTDWMPITITTPQTPRFCVVAQFAVTTAIVGPHGGHSGCDEVLLYSDIATGNPCDTVCVTPGAAIPPGTYWLFVAPSTFEGVLCGMEYHAWVNCDPCTPNTVTNLTALRSGDDVVLRWGADPAFTGTYTVFSSGQYAPWPDGAWGVLAASVPPTGLPRDMYVHRNAALNPDSQFYVVVRVCP